MLSSEPNIASAKALASSVLPTPVGPQKMKLPIGLFGAFKPTLARLIALEIATIASFWPITRLCKVSSNLRSLSLSPSVNLVTGTPVIIATTSATFSAVTVGLLASCSSLHFAETSLILSLKSASSSLSWEAVSNSWFLIASSFSLIKDFNCFSSSLASGHKFEAFNLTFELASSITSIALSGKNLSLIYLLDILTAATIASSEIINLWCSSYFGFKPLIISIDSSIDGSSIITGWKRLSNAGSFSIYFLYSSEVVAPITWISPLDKAGFKIFAASIAPSAAPAPIKVCISSITRIIFPAWRISSMIFFNLSSNSPRYLVPATKSPISNWITFLPSKISGTSALTILIASPSATAVLPTPGSPNRTGLFFVRLARIRITRSISFSLPTTGSKSLPNSSKLGVFVFPPVEEDDVEEELPPPVVAWGFDSPNILITLLLTLLRSTPKFSRTRAATPSPSRIKPNKRCSVPI